MPAKAPINLKNRSEGMNKVSIAERSRNHSTITVDKTGPNSSCSLRLSRYGLTNSAACIEIAMLTVAPRMVADASLDSLTSRTGRNRTCHLAQLMSNDAIRSSIAMIKIGHATDRAPDRMEAQSVFLTKK